MILLPCSFVEGDSRKKGIGCPLAESSILGRSLRKELGRILEVRDTGLDHIETVVALSIELLVVQIHRLMNENHISEDLHEVEIHISPEEESLSQRHCDVVLVLE